MLIKGVVYENFQDYCKTSMYVAFPFCTFKCEKDCATFCCENGAILKAMSYDVTPEYLVKKYEENSITNALVLGGLEPFDSFGDVYTLIKEFRRYNDDDIVIYTGYSEKEIQGFSSILAKEFINIIIKYGRYIPDYPSDQVDNVLGIKLASKNQYGKKIS